MQKNIVFMGTPPYATTILKELLKHFNVLALYTGEDKKVGRKQILTPSHTKAFLMQNFPEIPIFTPKNLKEESVKKQISSLKPDFIVVAAYGKILPKSILDLAPCINLHASLLPKYRGASPIQSAILNAEKTSGVCAMLMNEGLDTGAILQSIKCDIEGKNSLEVFELLANLAANLCVKTLLNFSKLSPKAQDESKASFCKKIKKEDGLVEFQNAKELYQKFLAFFMWPGIFLENGLKILDLEFLDNEEHLKAGEILKLEKESFILACKKGTLRIKTLQASGKKPTNARAYLNGKRLENADLLC